MAERRDGYRPDIEGLRAIAVLLVVAYHVRLPGVSAGFMGVDVFFVLSGYLITGLLTQEISRTGTVSIVGFYARRVRRLLPGAAIMLAATLAATTLMIAPLALVSITRTAIATSLYLSNAWFMSRESDYFAAGAADDPLLHTWSLAVEEQFYLIWPLLLLVAMRLLKSRGKLAVLLGTLAAISFLGCLRLTYSHQSWAFYASPARAWEFAVGGLACLIPPAVQSAWPSSIRVSLGWAGLVTMVGTAALASPYMLFPGTLALLPVLGTTAVIVAGATGDAQGVSRVLAVQPLQWLGRLSYSWYLWHWPVLVLAAAVQPELSTTARAACALAALAIAAGAYHFVENPVRFNQRLLQRPALTVALGALLTAVSSAVAYAAYRHALDLSRTPEQRGFALATRDRASVYAQRCLVSWGDARVRECSFGDTAATSTVVLFGDSHAAHWFPALEAVALERHWRIITMLKVSCPTADVPVFNPNLRREEEECAAWRSSALKRIVALRPDRVLLANSLTYVEGPRNQEGYERVAVAEWGKGVRRTLSALDSANIQSFMLRDTPYMTRTIPICLSRHASGAWPREPDCDAPRAVAVNDAVFRAEQQGAQGLRTAHLVDLTGQFCGTSRCEAIRNGTIVYFDDAHVTSTFMRGIAPALGAALP